MSDDNWFAFAVGDWAAASSFGKLWVYALVAAVAEALHSCGETMRVHASVLLYIVVGTVVLLVCLDELGLRLILTAL